VTALGPFAMWRLTPHMSDCRCDDPTDSKSIKHLGRRSASGPQADSHPVFLAFILDRGSYAGEREHNSIPAVPESSPPAAAELEAATGHAIAVCAGDKALSVALDFLGDAVMDLQA
jgi:hypothetical protein